MKILFRIEYHTQWGQQLCVCGGDPALGAWSPARAPAMIAGAAGYWELEVDIAAGSATEYKYCVRHEAGSVQWEGGANRTLCPAEDQIDEMERCDSWRPADHPGNALLTSAFLNVIFAQRRPKQAERTASPLASTIRLHRFQIHAPDIPEGRQLCVVGGDTALGDWGSDRAVVMSAKEFPLWQADVALRMSSGTLEYKYAIWNPETGRIENWETGANRTLRIDLPRKQRRLTVRADEDFRAPAGLWRGAGVSIPVFSLRSASGLGVGEFLDIKLLVDWAKKTGLKLIQLLPVNDTVSTHTWLDSYPYSAISVFALHPIYLNIQAIGRLSARVTQEIILEQGRILNERSSVDYDSVMTVKSRFYKLIYDESRESFLADREFARFFDQNRHWLVPYAVFSYLRDLYGTSDYGKWGAHSLLSRERIEEIAAPDAPQYNDIAVHYFIQYHLHRQLLEAAEYARLNGVVLKGDIPIGVSRHSVDTWVAPHLYRMDAQAGAPPDAFSASGQNWRFPTYNWEAMAADDFAWWRARLRQMSAYFDAFRIDHILGFFRIWEIPWMHMDGLMGHFNPAIPFQSDELERRGLRIDRGRLCEPYIRRHLLEARFGNESWHVARQFLDEYLPGCYRLKPAFRTQRQIDEFLSLPPEATADQRSSIERLKRNLFDLVSEVLFLEDEGGGVHPRSCLQFTASYRELDAESQARINELYVDYFYRRHEQFWREQAMIRLPAIKSATNMLICGEDLGMVPDCVEGVMRELGILSLFIQRMPKDPKREFHHPSDSPYMSVTTTGSHDMSTVRGWWEEDRERTQRFFNQILGNSGRAPYFAEPWVCREIVVQHLFSPSMWVILPLQDFLAMDSRLRRTDPREEQINVPSNPQHYWKYRMHIRLEDLLAEEEFNSSLLKMVADAAR